MTDTREEGLRIIRELNPGLIPDGDVVMTDGRFAPDLGEISLTTVFGTLWSRPGLAWRDRSLVTLGILIALRSDDELRKHFAIARRNGLSDTEIAEVIYHATGYAGFPAAAEARAIAVEVLSPPEQAPAEQPPA